MSSSKARGELNKHWSFKLASTRRVPQQPVGRVGRAPGEQTHRRDDQAVVRVTDGERDRVETHVLEVCAVGAPTSTRGQQCVELSSDIVNTMAASDEVNEIATVSNNSLQFKIPGVRA